MKRYSKRLLTVLERPEIDCCNVEDLYGELREHELPPTLSLRLTGHIDSCPKCQGFCSEYEFVIELARELKQAPMNMESKNRVHDYLNQQLDLNL